MISLESERNGWMRRKHTIVVSLQSEHLKWQVQEDERKKIKSCFKDGTGALLRFQQISLCNRTQQAAVRSFQFAFYIFSLLAV